MAGRQLPVSAVLILSTAWLVISVVSHTIRSAAIRKFFAWVAWLYVSALVLGIVDDVVALLET